MVLRLRKRLVETEELAGGRDEGERAGDDDAAIRTGQVFGPGDGGGEVGRGIGGQTEPSRGGEHGGGIGGARRSDPRDDDANQTESGEGREKGGRILSTNMPITSASGFCFGSEASVAASAAAEAGVCAPSRMISGWLGRVMRS